MVVPSWSTCSGLREVLEWLCTIAGGVPIPWTPPPLPQTKVTIVVKKEIYHWENLVGPLLVHKFWDPEPPLLILACLGSIACWAPTLGL